MPVRSSNSAVLRWPRPEQVIEALTGWARDLLETDERVAGVAMFGSYARGDWGVGSDADILIELTECDRGFLERRPAIDPPGPVPVDLLIRTTQELQRMREEGRQFTRMLDAEARWLVRRDNLGR